METIKKTINGKEKSYTLRTPLSAYGLIDAEEDAAGGDNSQTGGDNTQSGGGGSQSSGDDSGGKPNQGGTEEP